MTGPRYTSVYRNSIGSHRAEDFETVRAWRAWLLANPDTRWSHLIYATTGRVVESYRMPWPPKGPADA